MARHTTLKCLGSALLLTLALAASAQGQALSMEQVMSASELQETGVTTLTPTQRAALNRWLNDYTSRVLQFAAGTESPQVRGGYAAVGSGHWIKKVSNGGRMVELEDGSLWEVNALDRVYTAIWLPITNITVMLAKTPIGDYKYTLLNKDDGETALVKYLGK